MICPVAMTRFYRMAMSSLLVPVLANISTCYIEEIWVLNFHTTSMTVMFISNLSLNLKRTVQSLSWTFLSNTTVIFSWHLLTVLIQGVHDEPPQLCAVEGSVKYLSGTPKRKQLKNALLSFRCPPVPRLRSTNETLFLSGVVRLEPHPDWSPLRGLIKTVWIRASLTYSYGSFPRPGSAVRSSTKDVCCLRTSSRVSGGIASIKSLLSSGQLI